MKKIEHKEKEENPLWIEFKEIVGNDFKNDDRFTYKRRLKEENIYELLNKRRK